MKTHALKGRKQSPEHIQRRLDSRKGWKPTVETLMRMSAASKGFQRNLKHGYAKAQGRSPEYRAWSHMKGRCYNPNDKAFRNYGARGITVCDEWQNSFETFLQDMGDRPKWATGGLDRIDNNGNYEPSNCRWATRSQQVKNQRPRTPETCRKLSEARKLQPPPSAETREKFRQAIQKRPRDARGRMISAAA